MSNLGELLRQRRESLGLSLEDLRDRTKIRGTYLEAIERGDYKVIPGEVYLKGFIRSIASELDLDLEQVLQAYYQDVGKTEKEEKVDETEVLAKPAEVAPVLQPTRSETTRGNYATKNRRQRNILPLLALLGMLAIVAGGYWYWFMRDPAIPPTDQDSVAQDQIPPAPVEPTPPPETPQVQVTLLNPGVAHAVYQVTPGPLQVVMSAEGNCWLGVHADGQYQQTTLSPTGTSTLTVKAENEMTVRVGAPAVFRFSINGVDQGVLGGNAARDLTVRVVQTP